MNRQNLLKALPAIERYAAATLAVVCVLAIRLALDPMLGDRAPYMLFILTIVVVKRLWGRGPGLLVTLLAGIGVWYFIIEPRFSFGIANQFDALNLAGYFIVGVGISFLREVSSRTSPSGTPEVTNTRLHVVRQTAVLGAATVVLVGMVVLLQRDFRRTQEAEGWVRHTYQVISSAESLLTVMVDAESNERGFMLTGDARFEAPFNSAIAAGPKRLLDLRVLTSDNPRQRSRLFEISRLIGERLAMLKLGVEVRRTSGVDAAIALVRSGQGVQTMDRLRAMLDAVVNEERVLLAQRTTRAAGQASRGRWVLGLGSGALIILLVFASVVIDRETVRREEINLALRRHSDLLEQAHDSLLTYKLGGAINYWSHGAETLFGYTREEALGHSSHELLHTHHPLGMAQIDAVLERDGHWQGELTQTTKDGRKLIVEAQWAVAADAHGDKWVLEANRDITERKQAEQQSRLFEVLFAQSRDIILFVRHADGRIVGANHAATRAYGYSYEDLLKLSVDDLRVSDRGGLTRAQMNEASANGILFEAEHKRREGGTFPVEVSSQGALIDGTLTLLSVVRDTADRKRAEEALRKSEQRYRQLFSQMTEGFTLLEAIRDEYGRPCDFRYLEANPAFETHSGLPRKAALGRKIREVFPGIEPFWIETYCKVATTGESVHFEKYLPMVQRWLEVSAFQAPLDRVGVTFADISERKRSEAERTLLATAIEQAAETVVITDRDAKIQYVNPAFTRTTGYTHDEALGGNPRILKSGLSDAEFYRDLWAQIAAGKLWHGEFTNRRKDGTLYQEEATIAPVRDASGQITNYIAIKSDITERKRAETALRENEMMLRFFVRHAPAAIAMLDREMRYLVVSKRWMTDYRLGNQDLRGLSHYEVFPEVPEPWKAIHRRCLEGEIISSKEDAFPRADGSVDWISWEVRPWRKSDDTIGGIIIFSELITERKRAEEEVHLLNAELEQRVRSRTAELEAANRELEAFAHSVSHDLRGPLRGIDGWSLALMEDCGERLDAQGHKYLERVRSEAQRMGTLIDDLLHLSRVSRSALVPGTVDMTSLAETIVARLRELHPARAIEFVIAPQLKCTADARLLEVALTNLLANAVKFTGPRNPGRVELGEMKHEGTRAFYVRDNGVGFDMAYAKMLFAPFQRLHKTSEFPGTGIGLATVQRVIHRHGGRIWAEAQVGAGATLYFTLGENKG